MPSSNCSSEVSRSVVDPGFQISSSAQKRYDVIARMAKKMSGSCYKHYQFAAFQRKAKYADWADRVHEIIFQLHWAKPNTNGERRSTSGGLQDLLKLVHICDKHLVKDNWDEGDPILQELFPGETPGTRVRSMFAYFIGKFTSLYADVKAINMEAHSMERHNYTVDTFFKRSAVHEFARSWDMRGMWRLFEEVGWFLALYRDGNGNTISDSCSWRSVRLLADCVESETTLVSAAGLVRKSQMELLFWFLSNVYLEHSGRDLLSCRECFGIHAYFGFSERLGLCDSHNLAKIEECDELIAEANGQPVVCGSDSDADHDERLRKACEYLERRDLIHWKDWKLSEEDESITYYSSRVGLAPRLIHHTFYLPDDPRVRFKIQEDSVDEDLEDAKAKVYGVWYRFDGCALKFKRTYEEIRPMVTGITHVPVEGLARLLKFPCNEYCLRTLVDMFQLS